jgi:hypothetical protein
MATRTTTSAAYRDVAAELAFYSGALKASAVGQFKASPVPLEASALSLVSQEGGRGTGVCWNENPMTPLTRGDRQPDRRV